MTSLLIAKLPEYVVDHVKLFTGEGCWRNGRYLNIHRIPKNDHRYILLKKMPRIKQVVLTVSNPTRVGSVWYKLNNGKYVVIRTGQGDYWNGHHYVTGNFWEMYYNEKRVLV
jgi:hypothetical protein